jgi:hypothetical protein
MTRPQRVLVNLLALDITSSVIDLLVMSLPGLAIAPRPNRMWCFTFAASNLPSRRLNLLSFPRSFKLRPFQRRRFSDVVYDKEMAVKLECVGYLCTDLSPTDARLFLPGPPLVPTIPFPISRALSQKRSGSKCSLIEASSLGRRISSKIIRKI